MRLCVTLYTLCRVSMRENWETMTISGTAVDHGIFVALSFVDVVKVVFTLFFFFLWPLFTSSPVQLQTNFEEGESWRKWQRISDGSLQQHLLLKSDSALPRHASRRWGSVALLDISMLVGEYQECVPEPSTFSCMWSQEPLLAPGTRPISGEVSWQLENPEVEAYLHPW